MTHEDLVWSITGSTREHLTKSSHAFWYGSEETQTSMNTSSPHNDNRKESEGTLTEAGARLMALGSWKARGKFSRPWALFSNR